MKKITVNPFFKFFILILQFIIIFTVNDQFKIFCLFVISLIFFKICKGKLKEVIKFLYFVLFLSIFTFVFSYALIGILKISIIKTLEVIMIYLFMIFNSLTYKNFSSNKELAYVISYLFLPFSFLGYNQNKIYTTILIVLNQIYQLRNSVIRMYKYYKFNNNGKQSKIKALILLIPTFINITLKQNENFTISMINKNYKVEEKRIKPFLIYNVKISHYILLITYVIIEITIIGVL